MEAVQSVDWYIAPLLNPDGYEWSHTNYRMWRKNRSAPPSGSSCYGVDLNRNWDVIGFGLGVTSSNPCSDTYKGTQPGSEPETQAVAATIQKYKDNIRIYLTFHSYGQYWLTSWGYKTELPVDNEKLVKVGREACDAIKCVTPSRSYTVGSAGAIFYIAGGASDDYAKVGHDLDNTSDAAMRNKSLLRLVFPSGGGRDPLQLHCGAPGHGQLWLPSTRLSDKDCGGRALGSHRRGKLDKNL